MSSLAITSRSCFEATPPLQPAFYKFAHKNSPDETNIANAIFSDRRDEADQRPASLAEQLIKLLPKLGRPTTASIGRPQLEIGRQDGF